ncbi:hypothetical protein Bra3105_05920 [Brachybacterium halotolerans subsp. kimchii]|uniref:WXG100 family type VII secretion target n=1 Tax=Brachybacterium halotolerans TaxID=2795215 RepID=UPI001E333D8A|nr:hypothetical protein [Brachybacterium halotolerans]UEJ83849.1 hypothetical protein Bra3105_05920 [Brachybacterium halotolerans subsp. kimchii]
MTSFLGADTDQLRDLARTFQERSRRLTEIRDDLAPLASDPAIWVGPDGDAFRDRWADVSRRIDQAAADIGTRRGDLERQADEQDAASDAGGDGSGDDGGGLFGGLKDLWEGAKGIGKALSKISKGIKAFRLFNDLQKLGKAGFTALRDMIHSQYVDELGNMLAKPGRVATEFLEGKGMQRLADITRGVMDSPATKLLGKTGAKLLPGIDIATGIHQMVTADDGWDVASGGLSTLGGTLMVVAPFTGPAAPIVAGVGLVASGASIAIDAGKAIVENWDSISGTASDVWNSTTDAVGDAWDSTTDAVGDALGGVGDAIGSIF